jgi:putative transposase
MELVDQRSDADWLRLQYVASERRVCGLMGMAVASYRYQTTRSDEPLRTQLVELAREKPRFGYRRLHVLLGRRGEHVNHKLECFSGLAIAEEPVRVRGCS